MAAGNGQSEPASPCGPASPVKQRKLALPAFLKYDYLLFIQSLIVVTGSIGNHPKLLNPANIKSNPAKSYGIDTFPSPKINL